MPQLLLSPRRFSLRQYALILAGLLVLAGGILLFAANTTSVAIIQAEQMKLPSGASIFTDANASGGKAVQMTQKTRLTGQVVLPSQATSLAITAEGNSCGGQAPQMSLFVDNSKSPQQIYSVKSAAWDSTSYTYTFQSPLTASSHSLQIGFPNPGTTSGCSRILKVDVITFYGAAPPPPPPTVSISANPTSVTAGQSSSLTWTSTNTTSCTASGSWSGTEPTNSGASPYNTGALNANASYTITCTGASGSATGTAQVSVSPVVTAGDGTTGALTFEENFNAPTKPLVNTSGALVTAPQAANFGTAPTPFGNLGKFFGNWYPGSNQPPLAPLGGVTNYADLNLPVPTTCPTTTGKCGFEAIYHGGPHYTTNNVGQTTYHSIAFYVPAGGLTIANTPGSLEIQELHFANLFNGSAVRFSLNKDHVTLLLDTGTCVQGSYCQYHSDADHYPNHPTGSTLVQPLYAIPVGKLVPGTWNDIVTRVDWEMNNTGSIATWYRAKGGAWQTGSTISGIATTQFTSTTQTPNTWNAGPEAYAFALTSPLDIFEAGYSDGTGFAAVANTLP